KQQEKLVRKPVKYAEMYRSQSPKADCNYHQRKRVVYRNNYTRVNYNYSAKKAHPSAHRNMASRAVLMKTGLRPLNNARTVNTAHLKTIVYSAKPMLHFSKSAQSTVKRPYQIRTTLTNKNFNQKVNTAKGKFYTARPNSAVVNAVRANQVNAVKASACWVWRPTKLNSTSITLKRHNYGHLQKEDQGYVDSGCSRHMTGNMSYLSDFKDFDEGYVTFGRGAKGGEITGKGTLKTDVRTSSTPMDTEKPLLKNSDSDDVDVHLYRSMIGSLMYLTSSRPDIMFAVCTCARFQVTPKVSHLHAVKRIFSDYAGSSLDKKSTTGGCQFLRCRLISWQCKKQTVVATSSTEDEYVATASCYGQVLWI
ncbi:hypothetical protein Tco_1471439, partial [Tanacetum coccineum]